MQAAKSPSNAPSHADAVPNRLAALGAIAHCRPDTFEEHLETVQTFVLRDVLGYQAALQTPW